MSTNHEIADQLHHFGANIEKWRNEAARLTLLSARGRLGPADANELTALEETASAIYSDITAFNQTIEEVAAKSPAAAAELSSVSDAIRLLLLEITELGVKLYSVHSGMPHTDGSYTKRE